MKHFREKMQESIRSILEIFGLIFMFLIPTLINATKFIEMCFQNTELDFDNFKYYFLLQAGNWAIGGIVVAILLWKLRGLNRDKMFNTKNVYHDYSYAWYWFCAKVLGYKKCNMKLVPIFMQFKLALNATFDEYYIGDDDDYPVKEEEKIAISKLNCNPFSKEINLVLADTYPIIEEQIPRNKRHLSSVYISRNQDDLNRYFSPKFIGTVVNEVRKLPRNVEGVNIYATTNPKHTLKIACNAFKLADRGNINKLVVFQQSKDGIRRFDRKGKTII